MKHRRENGDKPARVRVTLEMLPKSIQRGHRGKQFDILKKMFKRACNNYGIPRELKEREYYVKPGEKRRKAERMKKAVARGEIKVQEDKEFKFDEYNNTFEE